MLRSTTQRRRIGDPLALTCQAPDHSIQEQKFITVGMSNAGLLLIAAHARQRGPNEGVEEDT